MQPALCCMSCIPLTFCDSRLSALSKNKYILEGLDRRLAEMGDTGQWGSLIPRHHSNVQLVHNEKLPCLASERFSAWIHAVVDAKEEAHLGVLQGLHDKDASALAHDKAVAVLIPRPGRLLWLPSQPAR